MSVEIIRGNALHLPIADDTVDGQATFDFEDAS